MQAVRATHIGEMAAERLGRAGCSADVLAVVSRAIYLRDGGGEILWLSTAGSPLHRRAILAPGPLPTWRAGGSCRGEGGVLRGENGSLDWTCAVTWREPARSVRSAAAERARRAFADALALAGQVETPRGFARLLVPSSGVATLASGGASFDACAVWSAARPVIEVVSACDAGDLGGLLAACGSLIGLGEGLTPSGDDFVGGLLFAERHFVPDGVMARDGARVEAWLASMRARTNEISHAILSDLARGHGPEPLHALVDAITSGCSAERIAEGVLRVAQIGQTSGWDLVAGVAAAVRADFFGSSSGESLCATLRGTADA